VSFEAIAEVYLLTTVGINKLRGSWLPGAENCVIVIVLSLILSE